MRKNLFGMLEKVVVHNEILTVMTKEGNAVILSEDDYNEIMETLSLLSNPKIKHKIADGERVRISECIPEKEVQW